jgi:hypothetical protein
MRYGVGSGQTIYKAKLYRLSFLFEIIFFFQYWVFCFVLRFEFRGSHLLGRHSTT